MPPSSDSLSFSLSELRRMETERVAAERVAELERFKEIERRRLRDEQRNVELAKAREQADAEHAAHLASTRMAEELTLRIANLEAEAKVERERFACERARYEAELVAARHLPGGAVAAPAPSTWRLLVATAAMVVVASGVLWAMADRALAHHEQRQRARAAAAAAQLDARLQGLAGQVNGLAADVANVRRADAAATPSPSSLPTRPGRPQGNAPATRPPPPPACTDFDSPLGCLRGH